MPSAGKVKKKLAKAYEGKVQVDIENECIVLSGELERWSDVVTAGLLAAHEKTDLNVINNITCTGDKPMKVRTPRVEDNLLEGEEPDVLIIGGGIIGCATARELSGYSIKVMLIEKEPDLAMQATGHSSGLVHSGVKLTRGSLKQKYTKLGNKKIEEVCAQLDVPFKRCGQYLVYPNQLRLWAPLWTPFLALWKLYWRLCGLQGTQIIQSDQLHAYESGIGSSVGTALFFPTGGVVDPQSLTIAYAENSVQNGAVVALNTMAQAITVENGVIVSVTTNRGTIRPKIVINAAGLFCEEIAEMAGDKFYSVHPVKGTHAVIDKQYADKIVKSAITLHGKLLGRRHRKSETISNILKTVYDTMLIGPFFLETMSKEDFSVDRYSVEKVIEQSKRICPFIDRDHVIKYFAGINAVTYENEFIICQGRTVTNLVHAAGISFPGVTASPAIAEYIADLVIKMFGGKTVIAENAAYDPVRRGPPVMREISPEERETFISGTPDYGVPVCHCEQVSRGEIIDALNRDILCDSVDAVSRRTRACRGKCQGAGCVPAILSIVASERQLQPQQVRKSGIGSEVVYGSTSAFIEKDEKKAKKKGEHHIVPALIQDHEDNKALAKQLHDIGSGDQEGG